MTIAITREISPAIHRCELTHLGRQPIDLGRARAQHAAYEDCLREAGCDVRTLPASADLPDCVFVEDCAVVLDEVAILTRPGAASRRAEIPAIEEALARLRPIARVRAAATVDGGDLLRVDRTLFVGLSSRTNGDAVRQLRAIVEPFSYSVVEVEVRGCLHLKSAATEVGPGTLLVNPDWLPARAFGAFDRIAVDPREPFGANALRLGDLVVHGAAYPRTRERLEARNIVVRAVDVSELAKAEGAVTCCSLIVA